MLTGFTLIELSIVLVIIGLIVGGVLVGRDLISASTIRAQISQIEKYQQAVNTFKGKYGYLPGDIPDPDASQFGFAARGTTAGQGDGNGILFSTAATSLLLKGEVALFWQDLSSARLINENFSLATATNNTSALTESTTPAIKDYIPQATITGNYIMVFNGTCGPTCQALGFGSTADPMVMYNYYTILNVPSVAATSILGTTISTPMKMTVSQAYAIDAKIDDGLPISGAVLALYIIGSRPYWADRTGAWNSLMPHTSASNATTTSCFDNGNIGGVTQQYSITQNNGTGVNCALSFRFK